MNDPSTTVSRLLRQGARHAFLCAIGLLSCLDRIYASDADVVFRARGVEYVIPNQTVADLRARWTNQRTQIQTQWINHVNAFRSTARFAGTTVTLGASGTSATVPEALPALLLTQGTEATTLRFSASMPVTWSTRFCAPFGGTFRCALLDTRPSMTTTISIAGLMRLGREPDGRYSLRVESATAESSTSNLLYGLAVDPTVKGAVQAYLDTDSDTDGVADIKKPLYLDALFPDSDQIFPIYTYLSAGGKFPFTLSVRSGTPVITLATGERTTGAWKSTVNTHPRLLYGPEDRASIQARRQVDERGWYSAIKAQARQAPVFPVPVAGTRIISEADWAGKEVTNARIALSAALVHDLEGSRSDLYQALAILTRFTEVIADPMFTYQWGQNALFASESLLMLCQAYDLVLGAGFPDQISAAEITENRLRLPPPLFAVANNLVRVGRLPDARALIRSSIEARFRALRDVIHLETHVWDIAGSPNHAVRNAAALGMSALLFNTDEQDAYENISLATTTVWKRLGVASSQAFSDERAFAKSREGRGYAEGPHYLTYAADLYLPFVLAYDRFVRGSQAPEQFVYNDWAQRYTLALPSLLGSARIRAQHDWMFALMMPDGTFPAIKDSNPGERFLSGLLINANATPDAVQRGLWRWAFERGGFDVRGRMVDHFVAFDSSVVALDPGAAGHPPNEVMTDAGNVLFRNGWDENAIYLHVLADGGWIANGTVGGMRIPYHQQDDNGSFLLHAFGDTMALDAGYGGFPVRQLVSDATHHNILLIDGKGPGATALGQVESHALASKLGYAALRVPYIAQQATLRRHVFFVDNRYFLLADDVESVGAHAYHWQLHGAGVHEVVGTSHLRWTTASGNRLEALINNTTPGGPDAVQVDGQSPHFETFTSSATDLKRHTAVLVREQSARALRYLAALIPLPRAAPSPELSTTNTDGTHASIRIGRETQVDYLLVRDPQFTGATFTTRATPLATTTDAQIVLLSFAKDSGRLLRYAVVNGRNLQVGTQQLLSTAESQRFLHKHLGDADGDGIVDRKDLSAIQRALGTLAGPADPRDLDGDGRITVLDARLAVALCTRPLCQ